MTVDYTNRNNGQSAAQSTGYDVGLRGYMLKVYNHMAAGVGITGVVAYLVSQSPAMLEMIFGTPLKWVVMLAPLIFLIFAGGKMMTMSTSAARTCFYGFAAVMGLSLSVIFLVYTGASIARVFFITSATFGALSIWGYTTKKDLTGMGTFLFMGLIGIIIAGIVNIFLQSTAMHFAISAIGVLIFAGLTAYDTQRIKEMYFHFPAERLGNAAIIGALSLYLDFINLMVHLLQFLGDRR